MKSKKLQLLIVLVVAIWGIIGYKIYAGFQGDEEPERLSVVRTHAAEPVKKEPYVLNLGYKDPFLKKVATSAEKSRAATVHVARPKKPVEPAPLIINIQWERLEYIGSVFNSTRAASVATISLDGSEHMIKEGGQIEDFVIRRILRDSIEVECLSNIRYIKRKNK